VVKTIGTPLTEATIVPLDGADDERVSLVLISRETGEVLITLSEFPEVLLVVKHKGSRSHFLFFVLRSKGPRKSEATNKTTTNESEVPAVYKHVSSRDWKRSEKTKQANR